MNLIVECDDFDIFYIKISRTNNNCDDIIKK